MLDRAPVCFATATAHSSAGAPDLGALPEWRLSDLYSGMDAPQFSADMQTSIEMAKKFAGDYRGKLEALATGPGAADALANAVRQYESVQDLVGRIMSFASLTYAGDTSDPARAKFYGDAQEKVTTLAGDLLFFELELNRLDDAKLNALMQAPSLGHYKPWLEDVRKERPHQLADEIEQLFLEKSVSGVAAWNRLFDDTIGALRFKFEGEELTLEPLLAKMQDPDENKREAAANALAATLGANLRTFALISNTLAKDKEISDRWRKFADIADSRHLANRVEREVVDAMVSAVTASYPRLSHRYYKLKARWFGKEQLNHWDRNAPLPNAPERIYSWDNARDVVLTAYRGFSPEMSDIARRFFDEGWIDAPVRPGKTPGAFSASTVPSVHPYVLMNYQGKTRDVMTLAHELGHGVHQVLAAGQGALMASTPLTLAETASVFGEMLTFQALLKGATDSRERKALIAGKVEDMLNTVVRQIAFYTFERKVHEARRAGELTTEDLNRFWMEVQVESLGDSIDFKPGYEVFWTYIPHFIHSPFYVYAYAFGDCLVNSLYALYEEAHPGFVQKYFAMLMAGGSKHHSELLAPFGLDASKPEFWKKGLGMLSRMIDELEAMEGAG